VLVAYLARTYETKLDAGFFAAKQRIEAVIETDIRRHIGGDTQRIRSIHARYDAITFKHLLLTVWLLAYRYNENIYQVVVNAGTGEVQGDRPYSWTKITLAILAGAVIAVTLGILFSK